MRRWGFIPDAAVRHPKFKILSLGHPFPSVPGPRNFEVHKFEAVCRVFVKAQNTPQNPRKTPISNYRRINE